MTISIDELKEKNLILFECISGSRAYGLETEHSDTDIRGVFYLPKEDFFAGKYLPQVANSTNDIVYYELGRFIELLTKNNPGALELLATPAESILFKNPLIDELMLPIFLSKLAKDSFAGYAFTQIKKAKGLNKKINNPVALDRQNLLNFCYILDGQHAQQGVPLLNWLKTKNYEQKYCGLAKIPHIKGLYALYYDSKQQYSFNGIIKNESANNVHLSSIPRTELIVAYMHCNLEGYSAYCREYKSYWQWVNERNNERYQTNIAHGSEYDSKNMMHTIRLLQLALEIVTQGTLTIRVNNREELLSIKAGHFNYETLLNKAEQLMVDIDNAFTQTKLPTEPSINKIQQVLITLRNQLYINSPNA